MKLYLSMLERLVDLPSTDAQVLRHLLDDLGLEVKDAVPEGGDTLFTIETLANRGDHLCALGVAREISARNLVSVKVPQLAKDIAEGRGSVKLSKHTDRCLRYALMEMHLPERLELRSEIAAVMGASGNAERHAIVHILNYILLEMGQPMHAFDRDRVQGPISVVLSDKEEEVEALDGVRYKVPKETILIRDGKKIIAVGGIIGCANTMVTPATRRVLVESATFDPVTVRKSARGMGLSTDASYTFERGADPGAVMSALKRLALLASGAGSMVPGAESSHVLGTTLIAGKEEPAKRITVLIQNVRREMNLPRLKEIEITSRLKHLGYGVENSADQKSVIATVPSWRVWSVAEESAVIEDFARVHGLNNVKLSLPEFEVEVPEPNRTDRILQLVEPVLIGNGFVEVITKAYYSAAEAALVTELDPSLGEEHISLKNALDRGYSHMKVSNVCHFGKLVERNLRQGVLSCKIYEVGRLFGRNGPAQRKDSHYEHEYDVLSLAAAGRWHAGEWKKQESIDELCAAVKSVIEALGKALAINFVVRESQNPLLHPGKQCRLVSGRRECGFLGVLHPLLLSKLEISSPVVYAEFDLAALFAAHEPRSLPKSVDFPSIRRDVTLKVPEHGPAGQVTRHVTELNPQHLAHVDIVDEFAREGEGFRRVTYRLTFQCPERTLEHSEIDSVMAALLAELKEKHQFEMVA